MKTCPSSLVAVDPGKDTGVAYFEAGELVMTANFPTPQAADMQRLAETLPRADTYLVERQPPAGDPLQGQRVSVLIHCLRERYGADRVEQINPGQWKPAMKKHKPLAIKVTSTHQRDAANMGIFYLTFVV